MPCLNWVRPRQKKNHRRITNFWALMTKEPSPYYLYVVMNGAGLLYTGIALDVDARLEHHNGGTGAKFTRGRGPWAVVHEEGPMDHGDALRREMAVKRDRSLKASLKAKFARNGKNEAG
jgi:putative endonuclease